MRRLILAVMLLVTLTAASSAGADTFDDRCRAAMAPYYAALLTSARGDHEGTLRHLFVLASRWSAVRMTPAGSRPAWANHAGIVDAVAARIERARERAVARNAVAAHAELEGIRALLRDARVAAGARTFDDAVTDYHEAMERLTGRAGLHNEIALNSGDYAAIEEQIAKAAAAWTEIQAAAGAVTKGPSWSGVAGGTAKALGVLRGAAAAHDMGATQTAAEDLKARYFELLAILSRA